MPYYQAKTTLDLGSTNPANMFTNSREKILDSGTFLIGVNSGNGSKLNLLHEVCGSRNYRYSFSSLTASKISILVSGSSKKNIEECFDAINSYAQENDLNILEPHINVLRNALDVNNAQITIANEDLKNSKYIQHEYIFLSRIRQLQEENDRIRNTLAAIDLNLSKVNNDFIYKNMTLSNAVKEICIWVLLGFFIGTIVAYLYEKTIIKNSNVSLN